MGPEKPLRWALWPLLVLAGLACEPERPPQPQVAPGVAKVAPQVEQAAVLDATTARFVLSYAAERGAFADTGDPSVVPERAQGLVRVTLLDGPRPDPGTVWVTNLREPSGEGRYKLHTVPRAQFEELALGQGLSSNVELPEGLSPPPKLATGGIVLYETSWCGVCKKVRAYFDRKGVDYVAKDIEKDREAAAELQAKASKAGVSTGSVPVIDVRGELIVGFKRSRLEQLLDGKG